MKFLNQNALVIGGTGGIGLETVKRLLAQGAQVAVMGLEPEEQLSEDQMSVLANPNVHYFQGNAAETLDMDRVAAELEKRFNRLDVLVHVAGISARRYGDGPLDECTELGWDQAMNINVKSVYQSNRIALQRMMKQQKGAIVNISSVLGMVGTREHFTTHAYAASRGAVITLSKSAAVYYAKDHIRINVVCPGLLDTPMSQRAIQDPVIREALTEHQPLSPHVGYPTDVAEAILFLASEDAKFITGIALPVDGGWSAQ
ncbi:SDR family oxidoreductase [Paenibacillus qinlingensis]|uniref:NAD(P)-dependent dehydrogenase (Short-subunit alcohol dehydrogenase family) n=1 Tax=Paenibacillus qinlingensis TaxID=1837343 RepID=A0ABU1NU90_9BACL|nr:SDR family oxidoreductase [Paenibacillus qinlingensis]MDR6551056.1 NAD(P)-dependent dehydrogenase (short-subunit alcohol dehydrogenase family) [Paenibacillus qinlingensis]